MVAGAVFLVLGFRFAPRLQDLRVARRLSAGAFLIGGILTQIGHMWMIAAERSYYRSLALLLPVCIGLAPCMLLPGVVERLRSPGQLLAPPDGTQPRPGRAVRVLLALWVAVFCAAGLGQLLWLIFDAPAVIDLCTRLLTPLGMVPAAE